MKKSETVDQICKRLDCTAGEKTMLLWLSPDDLSHEIIRREDGTLQFKPDIVGGWLRDKMTYEFNHLARFIGCHSDARAANKSYRRFYRDIGYTVNGYLEIVEGLSRRSV